jgi:gliding motility-associated-like protein
LGYKILTYIFCSLVLAKLVNGQYVTNGSATQQSCNCYRLTNAVGNQSGSVWNSIRIDLTQNFEFNFNIFLGCADVNGADGISFTLQPISTSVGSTGGGLGYAGITPSVGITIDTYQNSDIGDPIFDHIAIQRNGSINHLIGTDLAPPVEALLGNPNIEDCAWHTLRIRWNASLKYLAAFVDGQFRVGVTQDLVNNIFGGDPLVYWGFSGSTGGLNNVQEFCAALNPAIAINLPNINSCLGNPILFNDNSTAFGNIINWSWDFGDGSSFIGSNPPPKTYTAPGNYPVSLTITGQDGCVSPPNVTNVTVYSLPVIKFGAPLSGCVNKPVAFTDSSTTFNSSINYWLWQFGDGDTSNLQNPTHAYADTGNYTVTLKVRTAAGCESTTTTSKSIRINHNPITNFTTSAITCAGLPISFTDASTTITGVINEWLWNFGDGNSSALQNPTNTYTAGGTYSPSLTATNNFGCSTTISSSINVALAPQVQITMDSSCANSITSFTNTTIINGGITSSGSYAWQFGDAFATPSNPNTATTLNASHIYTQPGIYAISLQATSPQGCVASKNFSFNVQGGLQPLLNVLKQDSLCSADSVVVINKSTIANGALQKLEIYWDNINDPSVFETITAPSFNQLIKHRYTSFTTPATKIITIKMVAYSTNGCKDSSFVNINLLAQPQLSFPPLPTVCEKSMPFIITGASVVNAVAGTLSYTGSGVNAAGIFNPANAGIVPITANFISNKGCRNSLNSNIQVQALPSINAGPDIKILYGGQKPFEAVSSGNNSTITYTWSPTIYLNNVNILNPICKPLINNFNQEYTLTATTTAGCQATDKLLVFTLPEIIIPNTFTPNNDGVNDLWVIEYLDSYANNTVQITNRYGQLVFNSRGYATAWNGQYKNKPLPLGTYYYVINLPERGVYKGYVTIIR